MAESPSATRETITAAAGFVRVTVPTGTDTPHRQRIEIYPAAAAVEDGRIQLGEGHAANELASWTLLDRGRVDVESWVKHRSR